MKYLKNFHNSLRKTSHISTQIQMLCFHPFDHIHGHFAAIISADPYFADTAVLPC